MSLIYVKEHQIKKELARRGFSIPPSVLLQGKVFKIDLPGEDDLVLKAQVPLSSRYKKGFVLMERNHSKKIHKACKLLFQKIKSQGFQEEILIEKKIDYKKGYYLGIVSDPVTRGPLFLFSKRGGVDVEKNRMRDDSDFYKEAIDVLTGPDVEVLNKIFSNTDLRNEKIAELIRLSKTLFDIYREWNCRFIELNPLVETREGFCVLDVKMEVDEDAVPKMDAERLESLEHYSPQGNQELEARASEIDRSDYRGSAHFVQTNLASIKGRYRRKIKTFVGFNAVGTGVGLTAMDELVRHGFFPRNFCDTSGNPPASKIYRVTKIILSQDQIRGYFFISCMSSQQLNHTARGIIKAFKEVYRENGGIPDIPSLLLFRGAWDEEAQNLFREHGIDHADHLMILGRESSERDAANRFARLFKK